MIDVLAFVTSLKDKVIPVEISFHVGTYICNYIYYNCLQYLSDKNVNTLFIHVHVFPKKAIELDINVESFQNFLIAEAIFETLNETQL